jgi:hypothetical protein
MNKIIYFFNEKKIFSFSSSGNIYFKIKELIQFTAIKTLTDEEIIKFYNDLCGVLDDLIKTRKINPEIKSLTQYKVLYKNQVFYLGRNQLDQDIKIYIDLLEMTTNSLKIDIIELPAFTEEINNLLVRLKNEHVSYLEINQEILNKIQELGLIDIVDNKISLKDKYKKIFFFQ